MRLRPRFFIAEAERRRIMRIRNKIRPSVIAICCALVVPFAGTTFAFAASPLSVIDTDKDGTIDLAEAKAAASALFDKLDKDKEGTLDMKEVAGWVSKKEFGEADPDRDKTLSKDEYLALVEKVFKAADRDGDGTLDAKELKTKEGRALLRLLQ
jgi:EF hand